VERVKLTDIGVERVKLTDIGVERVKLTDIGWKGLNLRTLGWKGLNLQRDVICPFQHILEAFFAVTKVAIETTILYSNMAAVFSFCSV